MLPSSVRSALTLAAAVFAIGAARAPLSAQQTGSVTGTVVASGSLRPLSGAQVFIPGTGIGGLTNPSGHFVLLNVPAGQQNVQVQMLGYSTATQTVSVPAGSSVNADFQIDQTAIELNEVVVTGTGQATEKRKLGNTIATIDAAKLDNATVHTTSQSLQARNPGVVISSGSGIAGAGSEIHIRGSASLSQSNQPLIYVDGVRINATQGLGPAENASRLDDIDPTSIDHIEILKGASAATLYGTEASNGVIQIFTKRGQSGDPRWTLNVGGGLAQPLKSRYHPLCGFAKAEQPTPGRDQGTSGIKAWWGVDVQPYEPFCVSIPDLVMETGKSQNYDLSVSGGTDFLTYFVSGRYNWQNGILGAVDQGPLRDIDWTKQATANINILPTSKLRIQVSSRYINRHHTPTRDGQPDSPVSITMLGKPELATAINPAGWRSFGTLPEMMNISYADDVQRFGGSVTANYALTSDINVEGTAGVDVTSETGTEFRAYGWGVSGVTAEYPAGYRDVENQDQKDLTFEAKATFDRDLTSQLSSAFVLGTQTLITNRHNVDAQAQQFPGPGVEVTGAGALQSTTENIRKEVNTGVYAQEQLGFRNYLFGTVGARFDKNSAFGQNAGGAVYPKVSLSWVPSDMPGWDGMGPISTLRFRGALGQSGLQPGAFDKFTTFKADNSPAGPGFEPDNLGNPDLKPEVTTEWEAGLEAGLFNNRFAFQGTYWNRTVNDLLVQRQYGPTGGFLSRQLANIGQIKSHGVELSLNGTIHNGRHISVDGFVNAAYLHAIVTDLGGAPPINYGVSTRGRSAIVQGYPLPAFFGGKLIDAEYPIDTNHDGKPDTKEEFLQYLAQPRSPDNLEPLMMGVDANGNGNLLENYLGKPTPDWTGSFGGTVNVGSQISLSTTFEYRQGFQIQNLEDGFRISNGGLGRNTPEAAQIEATMLNPASTAEERLAAADEYMHIGASQSKFNGLNQIQDADFIRWREVTLSYRLPTRVVSGIGADGVTLTVGGRNLLLWTKYPGLEPEQAMEHTGLSDTGEDAHHLGVPRAFDISLRINF